MALHSGILKLFGRDHKEALQSPILRSSCLHHGAWSSTAGRKLGHPLFPQSELEMPCPRLLWRILNIRKSLQSQRGRHKWQRLCAAATDMTYGPVAMVMGAQPAHAQKHHSRLTGCCWGSGRQVFQRKDVFTSTRCPFVFILHPSLPPACPLPFPSLANRLFSSLLFHWSMSSGRLTRKTPVRACKGAEGSAWLMLLNHEWWWYRLCVEHQYLWISCRYFPCKISRSAP